MVVVLSTRVLNLSKLHSFNLACDSLLKTYKKAPKTLENEIMQLRPLWGVEMHLQETKDDVDIYFDLASEQLFIKIETLLKAFNNDEVRSELKPWKLINS